MPFTKNPDAATKLICVDARTYMRLKSKTLWGKYTFNDAIRKLVGLPPLKLRGGGRPIKPKRKVKKPKVENTQEEE